MAPEVFDPARQCLPVGAAEGYDISSPARRTTGSPRGEAVRRVFSKKFGSEPTALRDGRGPGEDACWTAIATPTARAHTVTSNLFKVRVSNGILGSFWINPPATRRSTLSDLPHHRGQGDDFRERQRSGRARSAGLTAHGVCRAEESYDSPLHD